MSVREFPASDESAPGPSDPKIGLAPAGAAGKQRTRTSGKRRQVQQPRDPWAGFKTGFAAGSFVSLSAGFILLGLWFRGEEGGPYRSMLGQPAIAPSAADQILPGAVSERGTTGHGPRRARSRLSIPMWTPSDPERTRILDPGTEDRTPGAHARSKKRTVAGLDESASNSATADAIPTHPTNVAGAGAIPQIAQQPRGASSRTRNRFDRRPRPVDPTQRAGRRQDNPERDLGIDALMKNHEQNRKTIGQATSLLKALGGN